MLEPKPVKLTVILAGGLLGAIVDRIERLEAAGENMTINCTPWE